MAYYFMVETEKGKHKELNIEKSKYFPVTNKKFKKPAAYTLQEIDYFTTMFNDEKELRNALLPEGILPYCFSTKPLSIRCLNNGKYNKVMYDFLYQDDIEYLLEPTRLVELVMKRYYQNDFHFIKKIAEHFLNHYECKSTAPEVMQSAQISIIEGKRHYHLDSVDKNNDKLVARLVKLIIIDHYEQNDGYIVYKDSINYRNLHELIAFINNYNKKQNVKEETKIEQIEIQENTNKEEVQEPIVVYTKKRTKKNTPLEGQESLFKI